LDARVKFFGEDNPAEKVLITFPHELTSLGPSHPAWNRRVAIEIKNLMQYIDYLKNQNNSLWFFLKPFERKEYNFQRWDGYLKIPSRPDIEFEIRVILTSEYPKVYPRAFAESKIINYCAGNIFPKNIWKDSSASNEKEFIMICHDHMKETDDAWNPHLSIAHFLLREIWYWWMSKINRVIFEWDKEKGIIE
jgi:hypothetical protein